MSNTQKIIVNAFRSLHERVIETQRMIDKGQDSEATKKRLWQLWGDES